jgi:hypothetical protein
VAPERRSLIFHTLRYNHDGEERNGRQVQDPFRGDSPAEDFPETDDRLGKK